MLLFFCHSCLLLLFSCRVAGTNAVRPLFSAAATTNDPVMAMTIFKLPGLIRMPPKPVLVV